MKTLVKLLLPIVVATLACHLVQAQTEFRAQQEVASTYSSQMKGLKDPQVYSLDTKGLYDYLKSNPVVATIRFSLDGSKSYNLKLMKNDLRSSEYRSVITTAKGEISAPAQEVVTYKGVIDDDNEQWVRLMVTEDRFEGYFNAKDEGFFVESLKNYTKGSIDGGKIVKFSATEGEAAGICGAELGKAVTKENPPTNYSPENLPTCRVLEIATDADWEFYNKWGLPYSNNRIQNFLNVVEGVYQSNFQLRFVITFQNVYTQNNDPYVIDGLALNGNSAADEIRDFWNANRGNVSRDLAHLFSGKTHNVPGQGQLYGSITQIGGVGQFGSICAIPAQSYSFTTDRNNGAYASTAHEIGHNFNAQHANGTGCCPGASSCGTGSIMCQGAKALPIFFNGQEVNVIGTHINNNGGCLGNNPTVTVNPTVNGNIGTSATLCNSATLALNNFYATNYSWVVDPPSLSGNGTMSPSGGSCYVTITGFYRVVGTASNSCGSGSAFFYLYPCSNMGYTVYPNPAKDVVRIEFDYPEIAEALPDRIDLLSEASTDPIKTIDVQKTYRDKSFKGGKNIEFDVSKLPRGTYYVHITNNRREDQKLDIIRILLE